MLRLRHHRRREAGATLTEYAVGVSVFALLLIGALTALEGSVGDEFDDRSEVTDGADVTVPGSFGSGGGGGGGGGGVAPNSVDSHVSAIANASQDKNANFWTARVIVTIENGSGQPVDGAVVTADISGAMSLSGETCTTDATGACAIEVTNVPDGAGNVVFTVTAVTNVTSEGTHSPSSLSVPEGPPWP